MGKIYKTKKYERDLIKIYKRSKKGWGVTVAKETMQQIRDVEKKALNDPHFGLFDPEYHSADFLYANIKNSHSIFFDRIGDNVVMLMADFSTRQWLDLIEEIKPQLDKDRKRFLNQVNKAQEGLHSKNKNEPQLCKDASKEQTEEGYDVILPSPKTEEIKSSPKDKDKGGR